LNGISFCNCGSAMSTFESQRFGKCGACNERELAKKSRERALAQQEAERVKKEQEKQKRQRQIDYIVQRLQKMKGKTIEDVALDEITDAGGIEAESVTLKFKDGTSATFSRGEFADGCRGCYDYYYYLDYHYDGGAIDDVE